MLQFIILSIVPTIASQSPILTGSQSPSPPTLPSSSESISTRDFIGTISLPSSNTLCSLSDTDNNGIITAIDCMIQAPNCHIVQCMQTFANYFDSMNYANRNT